jgi:dCTP deaminase
VILGKQAIRTALATGDIRLMDDSGACLPEWEPLLRGEPVGTFPDPIALQPASIDLHLGNEWLVPKPNGWCYRFTDAEHEFGHEATDSRLPVEYETTVSDSFWIPAHGFVLVRTREVIGISDRLFGKVEGRSSVGRLGLIVETAGVVDSGFQGSITCELMNCLPNPLLVHAGMRGCQITFARVEGSTEGGYQPKGKYAGQIATTGSLLHKDFGA